MSRSLNKLNFNKLKVFLEKYYLYFFAFTITIITWFFLTTILKSLVNNEMKKDQKMIIQEYHSLISNVISEYLEEEYYHKQQEKGDLFSSDYKLRLISFVLNGKQLYIALLHESVFYCITPFPKI